MECIKPLLVGVTQLASALLHLVPPGPLWLSVVLVFWSSTSSSLFPPSGAASYSALRRGPPSPFAELPKWARPLGAYPMRGRVPSAARLPLPGGCLHHHHHRNGNGAPCKAPPKVFHSGPPFCRIWHVCRSRARTGGVHQGLSPPGVAGVTAPIISNNRDLQSPVIKVAL